MSRCEICGSIVETAEVYRIKVLGKIRDFCGDCSTEIRNIEAEAHGIA